MSEDSLIDFFTDTITAKDLAILLNKTSNHRSQSWESSERSNFLVTKEHIKKLFTAYYNGDLKAKHLNFVATILRGSPRYGEEINQPHTFTYTNEANEVLYHLSVLNTMTPSICDARIKEIGNLL